MAGKAKKVPTTEEQVKEFVSFAAEQTNPGKVDAAMFGALLMIARGIDELRAEAKK